MSTVLYALADPESGEIRYIGKTTSSLASRLQSHLYRARRGKDGSPKGKWIERLIEKGGRPAIFKVEEIGDTEDWAQRERACIRRHRDSGFNLLNVSDGGNGSHKIDSRVELTEEVVSMLGVEADSVIAERLGVSRKAVTYHREKLAIPASHNRARNTSPPPMGGHNRLDLPKDIISQIGTMSDAKLAKAAGCSKTVIARRRRVMGIASYASNTGNNGRFDGQGRHPRWGTQLRG